MLRMCDRIFQDITKDMESTFKHVVMHIAGLHSLELVVRESQKIVLQSKTAACSQRLRVYLRDISVLVTVRTNRRKILYQYMVEILH